MIPLRRRGYCHDFGFTSEQEAEAWYFCFWSAEVASERIEGHNKLMRSYFVGDPIFSRISIFSVIFRMGIKLLETICECVTKFDTFFEQRRNTARELGHSTI
jgi:hypothetical protein